MSGLSERKLKVLEKIVNSYISTGSPVGSKSLCEGLGVSSSTIRNDMAELTSLGLLEQPYTSAGRIPSKEGYKLYIDRLLENEIQEKSDIDTRFFSKEVLSPDKFLEEALNTIANLTKCAAISITPSKKNVRIKDIQLVFVKKRLIMIVLVTSDGKVENKLVFCESECDREEIFYASKVLRKRLSNLELSKINLEIPIIFSKNLEGTFPFFPKILSSIKDLARKASCVSINLKGEINLFLHEDIDRASVANVVNLFNSPTDLLNFLENNSKKGISVLIGEEGDVLNLENFSIVTSKYANVGTLALIGPTRMNYAKIISNIKNLMFILDDFLNLEG